MIIYGRLQKMYSKLFNEITDIIERLQKVQLECEEIYIDTEESGIEKFVLYSNGQDEE